MNELAHQGRSASVRRHTMTPRSIHQPLIVSLLSVFCFAAGGRPAQGMVAVERDFPDLVARAEQIVAGTVVAIREDTDTNGAAFTYVTLDDLSVWKGSVGSTLTLRFSGGSVGGTTSAISDMPRFSLGEHAVVFVAGNGKVLCPLVGIWQGRFRTRYDESLGDKVVEDDSGRAIVGRAGRKLQRQDGRRSPQQPLRLHELQQLVADELATPTR